MINKDLVPRRGYTRYVVLFLGMNREYIPDGGNKLWRIVLRDLNAPFL